MTLQYYCPSCGKLGPKVEWIGPQTRTNCDDCPPRFAGDKLPQGGPDFLYKVKR